MLDQNATTQTFEEALTTAFLSAYYSDQPDADIYRDIFLRDISPEANFTQPVAAAIQTSLQQTLGSLVRMFAGGKIGIYSFRFMHPLQTNAPAEDNAAYIRCVEEAMTHRMRSRLVACTSEKTQELFNEFVHKVGQASKNVAIVTDASQRINALRYDLVQGREVCILCLCNIDEAAADTLKRA